MEVTVLDVQGVLEKEREKWASLKDENARLQEALDRDPQGKLLKKLYDDLQVVRTGVKDISGEVRKVNEQPHDPASRVRELEVCLSHTYTHTHTHCFICLIILYIHIHSTDREYVLSYETS